MINPPMRAEDNQYSITLVAGALHSSVFVFSKRQSIFVLREDVSDPKEAVERFNRSVNLYLKGIGI